MYVFFFISVTSLIEFSGATGKRAVAGQIEQQEAPTDQIPPKQHQQINQE